MTLTAAPFVTLLDPSANMHVSPQFLCRSAALCYMVNNRYTMKTLMGSQINTIKAHHSKTKAMHNMAEPQRGCCIKPNHHMLSHMKHKQT